MRWRKLLVDRRHELRRSTEESRRHPRRTVRPGADLQGRKPDFQSRRSQAEFSDQEAERDHQDAIGGEFDMRHHDAAKPRHRGRRDEPDHAADRDLEHSQHQRPTSEVFLQAVDVSGHKSLLGSDRRVAGPESSKGAEGIQLPHAHLDGLGVRRQHGISQMVGHLIRPAIGPRIRRLACRAWISYQRHPIPPATLVNEYDESLHRAEEVSSR